MWLWDDLDGKEDMDWVIDAVREGTLLTVTDGSLMEEHIPHVCSACFILECTQGRSRLIRAFPENSRSANAYRGELLGLMAIHLLLKAVEVVSPGSGGTVEIFSDCLGALG